MKVDRLPVIRSEVKMKSKIVRIVIVAVTLLIVFTMPYPSPRAASNWKVTPIPIPGLQGVSNNIAFAYDRFAIVAPYAPTKSVDQIKTLDDLNNCYLYVVDTKRPNDPIWSQTLETPVQSGDSGKRVYYPTRVQYDDASHTVYVRGTRFEKVNDEYEPIEVMAYTHLNLDLKGKPVFDSTVIVIDIKGVGEVQHSPDAPFDFALGHKGDYLVFTNGASFFSYNTEAGYISQMDIVPLNDYEKGSQITYLDLHEATNTVVVCWNRQEKGSDGGVKNFSELSFYNLKDNGILDLEKRVYADQFPDGSSLITGSNVVVTADADGNRDAAYFATSDGSVCQVNLKNDGISASAKRLYKFDDLAAGDVEEASPRWIQFDSANRVIGVVRQGFTAQIRRPGVVKRGIIRSLGIVTSVDAPAVGLVKLGKKNKVITGYFADGFNGAEGISSFITGKDNEWLLSTRAGDLLAIEGADDPSQAQLQWLTQLGSRTDRVVYYAARDSVLAIDSGVTDDEGRNAPGSLVVAKQVDLKSQVSGSSVAFGATRRSPVKVSKAPAIRRPCNTKGL
jgi:hypothetical protein